MISHVAVADEADEAGETARHPPGSTREPPYALAQRGEDGVAEEGEAAVGLRVRPVHDDVI